MPPILANRLITVIILLSNYTVQRQPSKLPKLVIHCYKIACLASKILSPILKACINNQGERLTSAIINFRGVNSNDKKKQLLVDSPKFLQPKLFCLK